MAACGAQSVSEPPDDKSPVDIVDSDGDGVADSEDAFPNDASQSSDTDGDGIGDGVDPFSNQAGCPDGYLDTQSDGSVCDDIDECAAETDNCDALVVCSNEVGGFTCGGCPAGYNDTNGDGTVCADIDECAAETDNCDNLVACNNTEGSFACGACPAGYNDANGDGTACADIDECATEADNCDAVAACNNTQGSFTCGACPAGYGDTNGDGTACADIDECAAETDNCDVLVGCSNTQGSFDCGACPEHYGDVNGDGTLCRTLHHIGGSVSGLAGLGLALENNAGDRISVVEDGAFMFPTRLAAGSLYAITVAVQPEAQFCTVNLSTGTLGEVDALDALVVCQEFVATSTPAKKSMMLEWSDVGVESYDVFYTTDDACDLANVQNCRDGGMDTVLGVSHTLLPLREREMYFVTVLAKSGMDASALAKTKARIDSEWTFDSKARAAVIADDGTRYIAGDFSYLSPFTGYGAIVSADSGKIEQRFPEVNGDVNVVIADGHGGWYIGGEFTRIGGETRNKLGHILPNGSVSSWDPNVTGEIFALALSPSALYVGGAFTSIGGVLRTDIAALDLSTGAPLEAWNLSPNDRVVALQVSGNTVYVGGYFTAFNDASGSITRNRLAALDASTGEILPWAPDFDNAVAEILLVGDTLYVGGRFTHIDGEPREYLGSVRADTTSDQPWVTTWSSGISGSSSPISPIVSALAISSDTLYVGGFFSQAGGESRNNLAAFSLTDDAVTSWDPNVNSLGGSLVNSLVVLDGTLYAGGSFYNIGENDAMRRNSLASWDIATGMATDWDPGANRPVFTLAAWGDAVYMGGIFDSLGGISLESSSVVALDAATGRATGWSVYVDDIVSSMVIVGDRLYVAGLFEQAGSDENSLASRNNLAAFSLSTGNLVPTWSPRTNEEIMAMVHAEHAGHAEGVLYISGDFTTASDETKTYTRNYMAALDVATGSVVEEWDPNVSGVADALIVANDTLYAGGNFSEVNIDSVSEEGTERNNIAAFDLIEGDVVEGWDPDANGRVRALALSGDTLYVGGDFNLMGTTERKHLAALNLATGSILPDWSPDANDDVTSIRIIDDTVYVAGRFASFGEENNPVSRNGLASIEATTGALSSWAPELEHNSSQPVSILAVDSERLYLGGRSDLLMDGLIYRNFIILDASSLPSVE